MKTDHINPHRSSFLIAGALAILALGLLACASRMPAVTTLNAPPAPEASSALATGAWVPSARVNFAHLGENTTYAIVYAEDEDLLVIDEPLFDPAREGRQIGNATWLIPVSMYAGLGTPIEFDAEEPKAYVLEALVDEPHRVVPAVGRVTVHARSGDIVEATISLASQARPPTAGGPRPSRLVLGARLSMPKRVPYTPQPELRKRH